MAVGDVFLYAGEASPGDIRLSNPLYPRGTWPGTAALDQAQNLSAQGNIAPWGVVLYPMGSLVTGGSAAFRPVGSPIVRRIDL